MTAIAPKVFANLDTLSTAFGNGLVKVGDEISVSGQIWDTAGTSLGRVRLSDDFSYLTARLEGSNGVLDALEAVSRDRSATRVTITGNLQGVGWGPSDEGIRVTSVRIPAIDAVPPH